MYLPTVISGPVLIISQQFLQHRNVILSYVVFYITLYLTIISNVVRCRIHIKRESEIGSHEASIPSEQDFILLSTDRNSWVKGHAHTVGLRYSCKIKDKLLPPQECEKVSFKEIETLLNQQFHYGYFLKTGKKGRNSNGQDHFFTLLKRNQLTLGVFDGHGLSGFPVARKACETVLEIIENAPFPSPSIIRNETSSSKTVQTSPNKISLQVTNFFKEIFEKTEKACIGDGGGSTGTIAIIKPLSEDNFTSSTSLGIFTANIGDSRAVAYNFKSPRENNKKNDIENIRLLDYFSLIPNVEELQMASRWMTEEQCFLSVSETTHARSQLSLLGYELLWVANIQNFCGNTTIEIWGPIQNALLYNLIKNYDFKNKKREEINLFISRSAARYNTTVWGIVRDKSWIGMTTVKLRQYQKNTIQDLVPSGGFGDTKFKPILRSSPTIVRGIELRPSDHCSTLFIIASDGLWDPFDRISASSTLDCMAGTRRIGEHLLHSLATENNIEKALKNCYLSTLKMKNLDDFTAAVSSLLMLKLLLYFLLVVHIRYNHRLLMFDNSIDCFILFCFFICGTILSLVATLQPVGLVSQKILGTTSSALMFRETFQSGFLSILYSIGTSPLQIWSSTIQNGHIKRVQDNDIESSVLEILGCNVATTFISCPPTADKALGITLPFMVLIVKNLTKYFTFEIQVLDDKKIKRRFRASNFQFTARVKPFICTMPMRLDKGWNQIQLNLPDFVKKAYGTKYVETVRVQVHANCRLRRIYFSDKLYRESDLPSEFKLYSPMRSQLSSNQQDTDTQSDSLSDILTTLYDP